VVSVRECQGEGRRTCPATASGVVIEQMVGDGERGVRGLGGRDKRAEVGGVSGGGGGGEEDG
jgi:hypothetical protein